MESISVDAGDKPDDLLSMPIACPQCGMHGLVHLTRLQNAIKCPKCTCEFLVAKGGRIKQVRELPHVRFSCPRCSKVGLIPAPLASRGAKCPSCQLPLMRGPDQKLRGKEETTERWKAAAASDHRESLTERISKKLTRPDGSLRKENIALLSAPLVVVLFGLIYLLSVALDFSVETKAQKFTIACLSGTEERTLAFIEDDAVQDVELKRWRTRHFTSIVDRHRPASDDVRVEVKSIEHRPTHRILLVTMKSPFIGTRRHIQHWREVGSEWLFDSLATLAEEDGPDRAKGMRPVRTTPARR